MFRAMVCQSLVFGFFLLTHEFGWSRLPAFPSAPSVIRVADVRYLLRVFSGFWILDLIHAFIHLDGRVGVYEYPCRDRHLCWELH